jgi:lipopolysaccharide biosynthesis glycosyltransferase
LHGIFAPCTFLRLLLPQLLGEQEKVIWLDTDILLFRDIRELWQEFTIFEDTHMIGAAYEYPPVSICNGLMFKRLKLTRPQKKNFKDFNAGVLLMDLAKLRKAGFVEWMSNMSPYSKELRCGDQVMNTS